MAEEKNKKNDKKTKKELKMDPDLVDIILKAEIKKKKSEKDL